MNHREALTMTDEQEANEYAELVTLADIIRRADQRVKQRLESDDLESLNDKDNSQ